MAPESRRRATRMPLKTSRAPRRDDPLVVSEILEAAFHRASLASPRGKSHWERSLHRAELKLRRSTGVVVRHLQRASAPFREGRLLPIQAQLLAHHFGGTA